MVGKAHAGYTPSLSGSKPVVILAIGSGARPGENVMRSLGDSLHLIFLNPANKRAVLVGVPRDSYLPIPGRGSGKINSSMVYGGPDLLVRTMEANFGVTIDYWALTTFWGFTDMINAVGGLTVDVPFPMIDSFARTDFSPGVQKLTGPEALAFSRDRHSLQEGDFGRQENGGRLLLAALAQFKKQFRTDQARLFTWLGAGMRNIETEIPLSRSDGPRVHGFQDPADEGAERCLARRDRHARRHLRRDARHGSRSCDRGRCQEGRPAAQEERSAEPHRERMTRGMLG